MWNNRLERVELKTYLKNNIVRQQWQNAFIV